jgi:chorismate mutase
VTTIAHAGAALEPQKEAQQLETLRSALDAINVQLLETLEARGRIVQEVMAIKRRLGRPAYDPERERVMMETLLRRDADVYPRAALEQVFKAIFTASRSLALRPLTDTPPAKTASVDGHQAG